MQKEENQKQVSGTKRSLENLIETFSNSKRGKNKPGKTEELEGREMCSQNRINKSFSSCDHPCYSGAP